MQRTTSKKVGRFAIGALALSLVAGVATACPPTTPAGPTPAEQFCTFWDKVADAPPTADTGVLVKDQVVALAQSTAVTGTSCTASNAKVGLSGATLAQGQEVPSEQGNTNSAPIAAVTGDEIAAGQPVLDNLSVQTLSADIGAAGITVRGNVAVRLSGVTSTIGFVGTLSNLDNWSVSLSSTGLTIPGITTSPVTFSGTLSMISGVPSLTLTAQASAVKIGDISVTGATVKLTASPATGVAATVAGSLKIGPSTASGVVDVAFDKAGALVSAKADISAHLVGTQAGGKKIDLTGSVKLDGNATETAITFKGSGILGDLNVNTASGSLTLATNKATFVGVIDVAQGANTVRFDGSIVWDGITAYTPFLQLQGAGSFSGTMQDGSAVSVSGSLSTTIVGGQVHTEVSGDFKIGTLKANGSAVVDTSGATTSLTVDANLVGAGFAAHLAGAIIITDGLAETVSLDATVNGAVNLGDVTLTNANLHIGSSYGSPLDMSFSGGLKVGSNADLTGAVKASFGPNGTLLSLQGNMTGSLHLDSWGLLNFAGTVIASPDQVSLSGTGGIVLINFPAGINFSGTFTSSLTNPSWSLNGSGQFRIASINVASARLSLSQGVGMKATRVGFYFSLIGIPFYFEGDFYMNAGGGCSKVNITGGSFLMKPLLTTILPGVIGCPVY
ncbi:MAG: hypothetical protein U0Q22_12190 [Acidimicrobiales bacterium]